MQTTKPVHNRNLKNWYAALRVKMAKTKAREKKDRYGKKYLWFGAFKGSVNKCKD